jgi:SOS response regulatory protein OraA/RecX
MGTAVDLAKKKLKLLNDTSDVRKNYQKIFRYLIYKGYDFETAHKAIEACTGKKEGLDD